MPGSPASTPGPAAALPGVEAVLSHAEIAPHLAAERLVTALPSPSYRHILDRQILARDEVCHVGEPVAVVVADSRYAAEDAAAAVEIDYRALPGRLRLPRGAGRGRALCASPSRRQFARRIRDRLWRRRGGFRRRRASRAGLAETAQGARPRHRVPRRGRRARPARRPADALSVEPGAAWRAARPGGDARARREPDRGPRRRSRRRVRAQARGLPRGHRDRPCRAASRPAGQVDRGPARALHRHHPGARPVLGDGGGDRRRRPPARPARRDDPRPRRLYRARAEPLLQRRHRGSRPLPCRPTACACGWR